MLSPEDENVLAGLHGEQWWGKDTVLQEPGKPSGVGACSDFHFPEEWRIFLS